MFAPVVASELTLFKTPPQLTPLELFAAAVV
jgi:hypothetical protein